MSLYVYHMKHLNFIFNLEIARDNNFAVLVDYDIYAQMAQMQSSLREENRALCEEVDT